MPWTDGCPARNQAKDIGLQDDVGVEIEDDLKLRDSRQQAKGAASRSISQRETQKNMAQEVEHIVF